MTTLLQKKKVSLTLMINKQYAHPIYQSEDAYFRLYVLDTVCFEQKIYIFGYS